MNRALALAVLPAIPALAVLFHLLARSGLRPLGAQLAGLGAYWALLALALACCGGWSLRPRRPSAAVMLALAALVLAAALRWGTAPALLPPVVLAAVALAAALNGTLEEAFWRGALIPDPTPRAQLGAGLLFVAWHLAPAAGAALSGQDAARLLAGAALIAPVMLAARRSSGTAGAGALAHALVNFWAFSGLAAANGQPA